MWVLGKELYVEIALIRDEVEFHYNDEKESHYVPIHKLWKELEEINNKITWEDGNEIFIPQNEEELIKKIKDMKFKGVYYKDDKEIIHWFVGCGLELYISLNNNEAIIEYHGEATKTFENNYIPINKLWEYLIEMNDGNISIKEEKSQDNIITYLYFVNPITKIEKNIAIDKFNPKKCKYFWFDVGIREEFLTCLWPRTEEFCFEENISDDLKKYLYKLGEIYSNSIDWRGESARRLWSEKEKMEFYIGAHEGYRRIVEEIGDKYDIVYCELY